MVPGSCRRCVGCSAEFRTRHNLKQHLQADNACQLKQQERIAAYFEPMKNGASGGLGTAGVPFRTSSRVKSLRTHRTTSEYSIVERRTVLMNIDARSKCTKCNIAFSHRVDYRKHVKLIHGSPNLLLGRQKSMGSPSRSTHQDASSHNQASGITQHGESSRAGAQESLPPIARSGTASVIEHSNAMQPCKSLPSAQPSSKPSCACNLCDKTFSTERNLQRHYQRDCREYKILPMMF